MTRIEGKLDFQGWSETIVVDKAPPEKVSSVEAPGIFSSGIKGEAKAFFLLGYVTAEDGLWSGFIHFEGEVAGRRGSFLIRLEGPFDSKKAAAQWAIVEGSGTGELAGISGTGGMTAAHGFSTDYWLEYEG